VAQLGGAHVACEWVSNILTKILQRPRLGAYLEQSTRYIAYDAPMPGGGYRYYRDPELGPEYEQAMDCLFESYSDALPIVRTWVDETYPAPTGSRTPRAAARSTPRPTTSCAACCPPPRSATWASTRPARPTSS
jgi:thymidylate synthase ThyX